MNQLFKGHLRQTKNVFIIIIIIIFFFKCAKSTSDIFFFKNYTFLVLIYEPILSGLSKDRIIWNKSIGYEVHFLRFISRLLYNFEFRLLNSNLRILTS